MTFDPVQYMNTLTELQNTNAKLPGRIQEAASLAGIAAGIEWALDPLSSSNTRDEILNKGRVLVDTITAYLEDLVELPFSMYSAGLTWSDIQITFGKMGETLAGLQNPPGEWTGVAGGKYADNIQQQDAAADGMEACAAVISNACFNVADYGYTFLFELLDNVTNVWESLFSLDPGAVLGAIVGASLTVSGDYETFKTSLGGPARALKAIPTQGGSDFPSGNWPIAAQL